jgi:hypothetical protein
MVHPLHRSVVKDLTKVKWKPDEQLLRVAEHDTGGATTLSKVVLKTIQLSHAYMNLYPVTDRRQAKPFKLVTLDDALNRHGYSP